MRTRCVCLRPARVCDAGAQCRRPARAGCWRTRRLKLPSRMNSGPGSACPGYRLRQARDRRGPGAVSCFAGTAGLHGGRRAAAGWRQFALPHRAAGAAELQLRRAGHRFDRRVAFGGYTPPAARAPRVGGERQQFRCAAGHLDHPMRRRGAAIVERTRTCEAVLQVGQARDRRELHGLMRAASAALVELLAIGVSPGGSHRVRRRQTGPPPFVALVGQAKLRLPGRVGRADNADRTAAALARRAGATQGERSFT